MFFVSIIFKYNLAKVFFSRIDFSFITISSQTFVNIDS